MNDGLKRWCCCAGQPRVGARPVTVSFSSGAGTAQEDTTTSSGPGEAQAVVGEGAGILLPLLFPSPLHSCTSLPTAGTGLQRSCVDDSAPGIIASCWGKSGRDVCDNF